MKIVARGKDRPQSTIYWTPPDDDVTVWSFERDGLTISADVFPENELAIISVYEGEQEQCEKAVHLAGPLPDALRQHISAEDVQALLRQLNQPRQKGLRSLADVEPETVEWLWKPYIPLAKVTIIDGDPGLGKSWLSLALATSISLGRGLPDVLASMPGRTLTFPPRNVLLLGSEDGLGDTIRPRLDALGADVSKIFAIEDVTTFDDHGLRRIEAHIAAVHATVVIVDPFVAYFGGNLFKANETRKVLKAVAEIAERQQCAVVLIRHITKDGKDKSIYRGQGSIDILATCRSGLLVGVDPEDPDGRVLAHHKSNLTKAGPSLKYAINDGRFAWGERSDLTAPQLLAPESTTSSALTEAVEFLQMVLTAGPMPEKKVNKQAADQGISRPTLKRARRHLQVKSTPIRDKSQRIVEWELGLPN